MKLTLTTASLLAVCLVVADDIPTKTDYKPPSKQCPTTLTVTAPVDCSGCTTMIYKTTATDSVDCHGCKKLMTSTTWLPWGGLCPACVGGVQTEYNNTGTSTVTSCSPTPFAPGGLASKN
ncbi:hypothetical protein M409DRAFT_56254 [Zasmidium cellare ATCC 36951]|uniref:Uncharacterized protein n=1 Tax=Zasmidium cellare ATCC 36951 TaxID=1080233 RepID=A0A6A6CCH8_ZASCE|nr:uncharacterized protein M409DRAFT_56254 [Zasmidium cellare ATCC 36951]KAF2164897.1 hypothetical protein M409DRAFT_56254 [Zasmidium cellare ATCC 36951]